MKLHTVTEAHEELGVSKWYIYEYIKKNNIQKLKGGYLKDKHLKDIKNNYMNSCYKATADKSTGLTVRELKVLEIVSIHFDDKKLAAKELEISFRTLQSHLANIRVKMNIGSTKECIKKAKRLKLI